MGRHDDADGDGLADQTPTAAPEEHAAAALAMLGYRHSDPVTDPAYPGITALDGDADDAFPPGWGSEPTERDQAAIDAGNAS